MLTQQERVLDRLRIDTPWFAEHCLKIIDARAHLVPLEPKPEQLRMNAMLEEQRLAGQPQRIICLKARKIGISTWTQGMLLQRTIFNPNHKAVVIAHDADTAGELFDIGRIMYRELPEEIKPSTVYAQRARMLVFGSKTERFTAGSAESSLIVDNAREFEGGRGFTYHSTHLSEVALWPDIKRKLTAILNAVPDEPETLIVIESTARGHNHFRTLWQQAEAGESDYAAFFSPWFEEPAYSRPFLSDAERDAFEAQVGTGEWGEDEPELIERFEVSLEQLNWRRWAIANRCQGDLRLYRVEYPATAQEAFLATSRHVFDTQKVMVVIERCEKGSDPRVPTEPLPGPERGQLEAGKEGVFERRGRRLLVPQEPVWKPRRRGELQAAHWKVWRHPDPGDENEKRPPGQYVLGVDVSGGEIPDGGEEPAWHVIEVVDHRTREQCAEYRSREDADILAKEAYLAALYWNRALLAIEVTGGYGRPVAKLIHRDYRYPRLYMRRKEDRTIERKEDRLGWDTNPVTKPIIVADGVELVREGQDGIRSRELAVELLHFVRDQKGRTGPESGHFADRVMAWLIAQYVATQTPFRIARPRTQAPDTYYRPQDARTNY